MYTRILQAATSQISSVSCAGNKIENEVQPKPGNNFLFSAAVIVCVKNFSFSSEFFFRIGTGEVFSSFSPRLSNLNSIRQKKTG
ncbi:hypothetical protein CEXT_147951 [Caerostris extrusa]|uniref:Ribosomal protein L32 n=1 Tax=Caerostris extrusa TaxID=172846 RepID=A0AAV4Y8Z0_CAEEX|nr:hypothetical protein CEXT_147951 [Caerostris extrusa]